ncbi:hypothetical protein [Laspinema olomoucense]|uniref:hypothetical protein n=1 Tax=Laspinema olomoucense TaxID=3231600 RepID=UPI0021BB598C|nr:hypothetical protein [Laspinema sp. D3d]MCT7975202.1 hypothetical protein [Laspinema sp. D3d]
MNLRNELKKRLGLANNEQLDFFLDECRNKLGIDELTDETYETIISHYEKATESEPECGQKIKQGLPPDEAGKLVVKKAEAIFRIQNEHKETHDETFNVDLQRVTLEGIQKGKMLAQVKRLAQQHGETSEELKLAISDLQNSQNAAQQRFDNLDIEELIRNSGVDLPKNEYSEAKRSHSEAMENLKAGLDQLTMIYWNNSSN